MKTIRFRTLQCQYLFIYRAILWKITKHCEWPQVDTIKQESTFAEELTLLEEMTF